MLPKIMEVTLKILICLISMGNKNWEVYLPTFLPTFSSAPKQFKSAPKVIQSDLKSDSK